MSVLPHVEVLHIDILVGSGLPLAPQEKTLLGRGLCKQDVEERRRRRSEEEEVRRKAGHYIGLQTVRKCLLLTWKQVLQLFDSVNGAKADRKIKFCRSSFDKSYI